MDEPLWPLNLYLLEHLKDDGGVLLNIELVIFLSWTIYSHPKGYWVDVSKMDVKCVAECDLVLVYFCRIFVCIFTYLQNWLITVLFLKPNRVQSIGAKYNTGSIYSANQTTIRFCTESYHTMPDHWVR